MKLLPRGWQWLCLLGSIALPWPACASQPFLDDSDWTLLREEAGGSAPYENLRLLTRLHRVPATPEFDQAADFILHKAREYGLQNAHAERFAIDGKTHYGLMRSHLAWSVESGRLWQTRPVHALLADWSTDPIRLADYSHRADVEAALVDVGSGTEESDYDGKDVRGKIVLADGVLATVQALAVIKHGAAGIVSDMPNQSTAWSGLDPSLVRWGHLDARAPAGFAFMVSRATAAGLRQQLGGTEPVLLSAQVQAAAGPGQWTVVTATIAGSDPAGGEIVYSCHLDHQRPGANDNGSGCVTILESARLLNRLISTGRLARPARTLRFIWGPEVEGTMAFLSAHPELRRAMRANVHMDMVGGDPFKNKSILHVTQTPWSLPSFVTDVGAVYAEAIREGATIYTEGGSHAAAAVTEERGDVRGTRNAFLVDETPYAEGSDHDDYDSSTIAVPSLYLRDWPDINIHTDHDSLDQIDPTKLRRVALLGAASGYTYAVLDAAHARRLLPLLVARAEQRLAGGSERAMRLALDASLTPDVAGYEARNFMRQILQREQAALRSLNSFAAVEPAELNAAAQALEAQSASLNRWIDDAGARRGAAPAFMPAWRTAPQAQRVPVRIGDFGPLTYQNDDVLQDRLGEARVRAIKLLDAGSSRLLNVQDDGALYAYEILNFVDGKRNEAQIRDAVSAEFGPLPFELVDDYLAACAAAQIIRLP